MWKKGHHLIITILKEILTHHNTYLLVQEMLHHHYILLREVSVENNQECEQIAYHAKVFMHVCQYHTAHINLACFSHDTKWQHFFCDTGCKIQGYLPFQLKHYDLALRAGPVFWDMLYSWLPRCDWGTLSKELWGNSCSHRWRASCKPEESNNKRIKVEAE